MIVEDVTFFNHGIQLTGSLYEPQGPAPYPTLIVLHAANGGTRQFPFYQHLITHLPMQGLAVLLYDRRGSGKSTGDFETSDFDDLAGDALAAIAYLSSRKDIDNRRIGVYGISQGGWIAPIVAAQRPTVASLIIVSGSGVSPAKQMDYAARYTLRAMGYSEDVVAQAIALRNRLNEYYRGNLSYEKVKADIDHIRNESWFQFAYIVDGEQLPKDVTQDKWCYELDFDPLPIWHQVHQPTLFFFAEEDRWVPVKESSSLFRAATKHLKDVTFMRIEGTDHLMYEKNGNATTRISGRYVEVLLAWLNERLRQV